MLRTTAVPLAVASLCLLTAVPAGADAPPAPPQVVAAYAYFQPSSGGMAKLQRGNVNVILRTNAPLRERHMRGLYRRSTVGGGSPNPYLISRRLNCYGLKAFVSREEPNPRGSRIRVRLRARGLRYSARMRVIRMTEPLARGGALGCTRDRKARVQFFNLTETPLFEPRDYFLAANAGPRIEDLVWRGWGRSRAVASGAYVSNCASCGEPTTRPARIVLRKLVPCPEYGGLVYRRGTLITRDDRNRKRRSPLFTGYPC